VLALKCRYVFWFPVLVRLRAPRVGETASTRALWLAKPTLASTGLRTKAGADEQDRTADLVLTKDALCQLSYIGVTWSGRRGSNPRPTAWKAVTLPLSYSRPAHRNLLYSNGLLRQPNAAARRAAGQVTTGEAPPRQPCRPAHAPYLLEPSRARSLREKVGGEGRVRTSVATRAADLQSAAIDRSATSPNSSVASQASGLGNLDSVAESGFLRPESCFCVESVVFRVSLDRGALRAVELAEGFEPPTG
jgi:hypothetical protein